jgi:ELWxxDGT repeat protein
MRQTLRILTLLAFVLFTTTLKAQLTKLTTGTDIKNGVALGNIGVMADDDGVLWRTDGTTAGTSSYSKTKVRVDTAITVVILNNKIYFAGTSLEGKELWVTDGTDAGTQLVKDINTGVANSSPTDLFIFNNTIYFFATTATAGIELWKSDGTDAGTVMVKDINPGTADSYDDSYTSFFSNNNILYFDAKDATSGTELWKTDGTSAGTVMLKDINAGTASSNSADFTALGTSVIFSATDATHGTELWKTDGTPGGTVLVKDIVSGTGSSSPQQFVVFQNKVFFLTLSGTFPVFQYKLYSTDGTSGNTVQIKSFGAGGFALLFNSVIINNKLYFSASTLTDGFELWSSDGTTAGTTVFDDINPGLGSSTPILLPDYYNYMNGGDYHSHLYNGKIFFMADDGTHGSELWITDGTLAGTNMVKDINPGADSSLDLNNAQPWFYTTTDFYFTANDKTHGIELWKSNGTSGGTAIVKDLNPGTASSDPFMFMFVNSHIYLTANDGDGFTNLFVVDASVTLPVSLLSFDAVRNKDAVDVKWITTTETNTKDYIVQRSYNGMQFQNIGTVQAAGNSTKQLSYLFKDADALQTGANKIYYRLQIRDNDGKMSYSKIALLNILANGSVLAVYPNPVKDQLYLVTNTAVNAATVRISNTSGKVVFVQQFENIQAGEKNKINVAALAKGVYYMEFITTNGNQSIRFIKY